MKNELTGHDIVLGSKVRSFDFPVDKSLEGERACYVEGEVVDFKTLQGCERYVIRVERTVWGGEETDKRGFGGYIYPPRNGTPTLFGNTCDGVELLDA